MHLRACACVRACAVEIKPGMLRAACFNDVRVWSRIRFALQDGDFSLQSRVIQYGLLSITNHDLFVVETDIGNTLLCTTCSEVQHSGSSY